MLAGNALLTALGMLAFAASRQGAGVASGPGYAIW